MKTLCAFFVVSGHCPFTLEWIQPPGLVVDIFFLITGYFLFDEQFSVVQSRTIKSIKKIIPLAIVLHLIYSPWYHLGSPTKNWVNYFRLLVQGIGSFDAIHLWYLTALVLGLITLSIYIRFLGNRRVIYLAVLPITWIFLELYRYFLDGVEESPLVYNFITRSLPYLAIGYWIKMREEWILRKKNAIGMYLLIAVLGMFEALIVGYLSDGYTTGRFMTRAIAPVFLFILFISNKNWGRGSILETIGQRYSGNIYYFHILFILFFEGLLNSFSQLVYFWAHGAGIIVFLLSLAWAWLIERLQKKIGYVLFP